MISCSRRPVGTHARRVVRVHVQEVAPATILLAVARAQHVAAARAAGHGGRLRQSGPAIAFPCVFDAGELHRRCRCLAEVDAGFDRHAGGIRVRGPAEEASVWHLVVAALGDVVADLFDRRRRLVRRQVVQAHQAAVAADFARVATAGFRAAGFADGGVVLEAGAAVAFLAVFEAGEVEVVAFRTAIGLAGLDGHAGGARVGGTGEGAWVDGVVGAA